MAKRTCAKCGAGFGFQDIPFGYKEMYVHTWHFDNLSACSNYLKTFGLPDVYPNPAETATEWSLKKYIKDGVATPDKSDRLESKDAEV